MGTIEDWQGLEPFAVEGVVVLAEAAREGELLVGLQELLGLAEGGVVALVGVLVGVVGRGDHAVDLSGDGCTLQAGCALCSADFPYFEEVAFMDWSRLASYL